MLAAIMRILGLDEEGKKQREKAREMERRERAERVRKEAQAMKKAIKN